MANPYDISIDLFPNPADALHAIAAVVCAVT
jgi:hypothetical protein